MTTMSERPRYAHVRMGVNQVSLQDMGTGPRVFAAEWHEGGYFNHAGSCAVVSPDDLRTIKGTELHPLLVEALQRSRARGGRTVAIRDAKGRWEAIRITIEAARQ
jgi:hypothetical protein